MSLLQGRVDTQADYEFDVYECGAAVYSHLVLAGSDVNPGDPVIAGLVTVIVDYLQSLNSNYTVGATYKSVS